MAPPDATPRDPTTNQRVSPSFLTAPARIPVIQRAWDNMVCGKALETLVAVAITGKVDVSTFVASQNMTINAGDRCVRRQHNCPLHRTTITMYAG